MTDEYAADPFNDTDLNGMHQIITADYAYVPGLRKQAKAYRSIVELLDRHESRFGKHMDDTGSVWSSKGASGFFNETAQMSSSMKSAHQSALMYSKSMDEIADKIETTKTEVDRIKGEWDELEKQYQSNPHVFDAYDASGRSGYNDAKADYTERVRNEMRGYSDTATAATYTKMPPTTPYSGPTTSKEPRTPVIPTDPGGNDDGGTPQPPLDTPDPAAAMPDPTGGTPGGGGGGEDGPQIEYISVPAGPGPTGSAPAPAPAPAPQPGLFPGQSGGLPPYGPGGGPGTFPASGPKPGPGRPGVLGPQRPSTTPPAPRNPPVTTRGGNTLTGRTQAAPGGRTPMAPKPPTSGKASPSVIGKRGADGGRPAAVRNQRPAATPKPEQGVIRNPKQKAEKKKDEHTSPTPGSDVLSDELFDGLSLDAVDSTLRAKTEENRVRRRDAGPALRRTPRPRRGD